MHRKVKELFGNGAVAESTLTKDCTETRLIISDPVSLICHWYVFSSGFLKRISERIFRNDSVIIEAAETLYLIFSTRASQNILNHQRSNRKY
jgi:hypothetical protein